MQRKKTFNIYDDGELVKKEIDIRGIINFLNVESFDVYDYADTGKKYFKRYTFEFCGSPKLSFTEKMKYKRYCKGEGGIYLIKSPDHYADVMDIGKIIEIGFNSGNRYKMRLIDKEWRRNGLYDSTYEMTNDIQPLSEKQFWWLSDRYQKRRKYGQRRVIKR